MSPGRALWVINSMGGGFCRTNDCEMIKGYIDDREGTGVSKTYLDATECRELGEAFTALADALAARVDFVEEAPPEVDP